MRPEFFSGFYLASRLLPRPYRSTNPMVPPLVFNWSFARPAHRRQLSDRWSAMSLWRNRIQWELEYAKRKPEVALVLSPLACDA
jgi:hypothetical protein